MSGTIEWLWKGLRTLVSHPGQVHERIEAARASLPFAGLDQHGIPDDIQTELKEVLNLLLNDTDDLDDSQASDAVIRLFDAYLTLLEHNAAKRSNLPPDNFAGFSTG